MMLSDADLEMAVPEPRPTADDPFALGWRYPPPGEDGELIPLTEEDLVFPAEGDFVVNNFAHMEDRDWLFNVFRTKAAGRPGLRVLADHIVDFEVEGLNPLGPDVILLNGEEREWDPGRGVFPVKQMAARPLIVVEVTSPSTRKVDLTEKAEKFFQAGVPLYIIIDLPYGGGRRPQGIVAYQAGPTGYERLQSASDGRVWVEVLDFWLTEENGRVACYEPVGTRIPNYLGMSRQVKELTKRSEAAEQRITELEAELRRLRGGNP